MTDTAFYAHHTPASDPGRHGALLAALDPDAESMPKPICGLMTHPMLAAMDGIMLSDRQDQDRQARTMRAILARLLERDARPLDRRRDETGRFYGVCRDHALFGAAVLRQHGRPARLRVGFADYFTPGFLEDHWVCEVWHDGSWRLVDMQLDAAAMVRFAIGFPASDVPRDRFLTAPEAWLAMRRGTVDGWRMGVSQIAIAGSWFAAGSVARDAAALAGIELLPWDYWGEPDRYGNDPALLERRLGEIDALAEELAGDRAGHAAARRALAARDWLGLPTRVTSYEGPDDPAVWVELPR